MFRQPFGKCMAEAVEDELAIGAPQDLFAGAFGVGHKAGDVALFVADARNVAKRAVRIRIVRDVASGIDVTPKDLVVGFET